MNLRRLCNFYQNKNFVKMVHLGNKKSEKIKKILSDKRHEITTSFRDAIETSQMELNTSSSILPALKPFHLVQLFKKRNCKEQQNKSISWFMIFITICIIILFFAVAYLFGFVNGFAGSMFPFDLISGNIFELPTICY